MSCRLYIEDGIIMSLCHAYPKGTEKNKRRICITPLFSENSEK